MLKDLIIQHKAEKQELLKKQYMPRQKLEKSRELLDQDLIKVITGPRRAGKSVFALLLLQDRGFAYLNFDDNKLVKIDDYDKIVKALFEVYPDPEFILFDEIQNLKNWELFVNKLQRRGHNLILTGSNARLLSKELATALTGRHIPIEILPFSFYEFLQAKDFHIKEEFQNLPEQKGKLLNYMNEYLKKGGYPEVVVKNLDPKLYLETLFDAVLLKDVVKRHRIRHTQKIYDLAVYLVSNFSSEFSFNKLKNILDFGSVNTLQNYMSYLEEAYLCFSLNRFSFKKKQQLKASRKLYLPDNGFVLAKAFQFSSNVGRLMENLIFIENIRRGYQPNFDLFYYKTKNQKEVDFVLRKGSKIEQLIQVCYDLTEFKVKKREVSALLEASEELKCNNLLVITGDTEKTETLRQKTIKFIPLWKWLLQS